jgi:regulator of protease activity HflC (stomatin/prohibitin superfamily)
MKNFIVMLMLMSTTGCGLWPPYNAWQQEWEGKAELAKADYSKQVAVQEAKAKEEAAKYLANAEIARAEGVSKANQIIGTSLKDNEAYLRWLYIEGLKEKTGSEIIYVPTEAGLPILEAGRRGSKKEQEKEQKQ